MKNILFNSMKTNKVLNRLILVILFGISGCVQDDEFSIPHTLGIEENDGLNEIIQNLVDGTLTEVSIENLVNFYSGRASKIESDIVVKGYVTSSDRRGNFYKEFYMQDSPENPTGAIAVLLNQVDSYNQFNKGREVYILLKGLYLGENSSEVVAIGGKLDDTDLEEMSPIQIPNHIFRTTSTLDIKPLILNFSEIDDQHLGMLISFDNVQFLSNLSGETFVAGNDYFDTKRKVEQCEDGSEFLIETSSFADFKQLPLPVETSGSIYGVITQSFGGRERVMVLNSPNDINFNETRCD